MQFQIASVDSMIIGFSKTISEQNSGKIQFYFEQIKKLEGIIEVIPSYTTLFIQYDIFKYDFNTLQTLIKSLKFEESTNQTKSKRLKVPVYYGQEVAVDLERISTAKNITIEQIIKLHTSTIYKVYAIGFLPGFAYLADVPESIAMPRLSTPRKMVPKGSVAIANNQTAIYPQNSPGGWNIIGRTTLNMFDKALDSLCPVQMGDEVEFYAISKEEYLLQGGTL